MNAIVERDKNAASNNPFAAGAIAQRGGQNAMADAGQQREIAEVQAAMTIAQRFPRDPVAATDRILRACTRPTLAEGALYQYSRGGTAITGPSIRLAEAAAQAWGNIDFGIREVEQRNGESTVQAYAWDMETNTRQVKVFQVPHKRHTRKASYRLEDPRDIYELVANQGARRLRACILGVIPGDVIEAAVKQCEETLRASADTSPEGLKKLVDAFDKYGVTKEQIEKRTQCRLEAIRPAQVVQLKKVYASLRDGMSSTGDWFETDDTSARDVTAEITGKKRQRKTPAPAPTPEAATEGPGLTAQEVHDVLTAAETRDDLDEAADLINTLPEAEREPLRELYDRRALEFVEK